jgi:hypothetical protein
MTGVNVNGTKIHLPVNLVLQDTIVMAAIMTVTKTDMSPEVHLIEIETVGAEEVQVRRLHGSQEKHLDCPLIQVILLLLLVGFPSVPITFTNL